MEGSEILPILLNSVWKKQLNLEIGRMEGSLILSPL